MITANVPVQMKMLLVTSAIVVLTDIMDFHNVPKVYNYVKSFVLKTKMYSFAALYSRIFLIKFSLFKFSLFNLQVVIMCGLAVQVQVHAMLTKEIVILMKTASEIWFVESQIVLVLNFLPM